MQTSLSSCDGDRCRLSFFPPSETVQVNVSCLISLIHSPRVLKASLRSERQCWFPINKWEIPLFTSPSCERYGDPPTNQLNALDRDPIPSRSCQTAALYMRMWKEREEVKNIVPVAVPVNERRRGVYKRSHRIFSKRQCDDQQSPDLLMIFNLSVKIGRG